MCTNEDLKTSLHRGSITECPGGRSLFEDFKPANNLALPRPSIKAGILSHGKSKRISTYRLVQSFTAAIFLTLVYLSISPTSTSLPKHDLLGRPYCERSLTFVLSDCCDFSFQMIGLVNAMIYAEDTGRSFFLADKNWNYGRWGSFFKKLAKPSCIRPETSDLYVQFPNTPLGPDELRETEAKFKTASHVVMNRWSWYLLDEHIETVYHEKKHSSGIPAYAKIFKAQERVLHNIWHVNKEVQNLVHRECEVGELPYARSRATKDNFYIALQIQRVNHIGKYVAAAERVLQRIPQIKNEITVFVNAHTNTSHARRRLMKRRPDWKVVVSFEDDFQFRLDDTAPDSKGLMAYDLESRVDFGMAFVTDIVLMAEADHLVCSFGTPVCRLVTLLKGLRKVKSTTSIDKQWFSTLYPLNGYNEVYNPHKARWKKQPHRPTNGDGKKGRRKGGRKGGRKYGKSRAS
ncbi:10905_t:CDS:2 [Paraglomus occultum]|uniref:10905_t:CDS:1 n=1 Tax=Paraglomus occultum TaxID=144539 RepID=A0A9N9AT54_9GLOM|nr:10905_t:CDS:2 [Paraglomus occultum]